MLIAVPTGVKIFNWIGTMFRGSVSFKTPMLFAVGFISMFIIGGLSGVMHASPPADLIQHDTYFIVAHIHYVLIGGSILALFAGVYYWFPKMSGRMMNETLGQVELLDVHHLLQPDVHAHALDRPAGHAAARLHVRPRARRDRR